MSRDRRESDNEIKVKRRHVETETEAEAGAQQDADKKKMSKPVKVRIWLEGTDENCTDELRSADYQIQLRFIGTDEDGNLLEDARSS